MKHPTKDIKDRGVRHGGKTTCTIRSDPKGREPLNLKSERLESKNQREGKTRIISIHEMHIGEEHTYIRTRNKEEREEWKGGESSRILVVNLRLLKPGKAGGPFMSKNTGETKPEGRRERSSQSEKEIEV